MDHRDGAGPGGPLAGLRVVDVAGEPGVFATRMLAELGADVVRVEPPDGGRVRRRVPYLDREAGIERSLHHLHFNAGKRSVVADLDTPDGQALVRDLAASADALVETEPPGAMDARGLGAAELRSRNPGLVYVTVTPFGPDGPLGHAPGNDLTSVAAGGLMYLNGFPEDPPVQPGAEQGYHMGSLVAAATLLVALAGRERDPHRRGHRIDVSLQEAVSMATLQTANANIFTWHGTVPRRQGLVTAAGGRSLFECRDGRWLSFTVPLGAPALWAAFVAWMGEEGLADAFADPGWDDPAYRATHADVTAAVLEQLCTRYDRDHLFHEGQRRRMLAMPVNTAGDLVESDHLRARRFFSTVHHDHFGRDLVDVGPPYRFSATPAGIRRPAPRLGEHTGEVQAELARSTPPPAAPAASGDDGVPPERLLEGLRVADFCWMIAGPSTTRVLADYGADVIKIESASRVDNIRAIGVQPGEPGSINTNGVFNDCNTNKRSITLNLADPRGVELAREIVRRSDIVTSNFTGDRMERWGLGYDDLKAIKPDIIVLSMPAMGATGPYVRYGSYGNGLIAFSGLNQNMGFPDRPPTGMAALYSDFSSPYASVAAAMAALVHRQRTGKGQFVEVAQSEATVNLLGTDILECTANGDLVPRVGNRSRDDVPHGAFRCAGEDRWCAVAARTDEEWRRLAAVIGRTDLAADPGLATVEGRRAREDEIETAITAWTCARDAWDAAAELQAADVPASVVEDLSDMVARDPQLPGRHLVPVRRDGLVFHTHAQPARVDGRTPPLRAAPHFGEHNEAVFRRLVGLSEAEFIAMLVDEVIH